MTDVGRGSDMWPMRGDGSMAWLLTFLAPTATRWANDRVPCGRSGLENSLLEARGKLSRFG
jgi:hypothetical protein